MMTCSDLESKCDDLGSKHRWRVNTSSIDPAGWVAPLVSSVLRALKWREFAQPEDGHAWQSTLHSAVNTREYFSVLYKTIVLKNSGLTLEFGFLVGIGRSGVMIGRLFLNMIS